jgi:aryl-alcohol dehydrogenase-like predicted oxidoreductase
VDVVLSGAATVVQLESNLGALALQPGPELVEHLDVLRENPVTYWQTRVALPWN